MKKRLPISQSWNRPI